MIDLQSLVSVPEESITKFAELYGSKSTFQQCLRRAKKFRTAGLTPIFLLDTSTNLIYVGSKESVLGELTFH